MQLKSPCLMLRNKFICINMRKKIFIKSDCGDGIRNEVFKYDYTDSLEKYMHRDENGFWYSCGLEVLLEQKSPCRIFYKKVCSEVESETMPFTNQNEEVFQIRERVNDNGLEVIIIQKKNIKTTPAIVVSLGGPIISIPDFMTADSIYSYFIQQGYSLIIPLRRGISGISIEWERALEGHYGKYDLEDIIEATDFVLSHYAHTIDIENVFLYGGSYGGYMAELIAGKANSNKRFKAIVAHCGVYDIATYPWHCQGIPEETMKTYGNTTDKSVYPERVKEISPKTFIANWNVPILLVHHLNDTTTWVGQSVAAYNDALNLKKQVILLIVQGPHTYDIPQKESLFLKIVTFFETCKLNIMVK